MTFKATELTAALAAYPARSGNLYRTREDFSGQQRVWLFTNWHLAPAGQTVAVTFDWDFATGAWVATERTITAQAAVLTPQQLEQFPCSPNAIGGATRFY